MTSFFSKIRGLAHWREWELNPVVVKELRQAVRSWAVTGTLLLFLVVLFCTAFGTLVSRFDADIQAGGAVFRVFLIILSGASLAFIPLYVGVRLASERQDSNLDLLYITTLTPGRIIRGKLLCGAYMAVLFFSACMPFMAFTTLMRGVDLPTIFFILVCLFLAVCIAVQGAIFLACLPVTRVLKILVAIFGVMWMFSAVVPIIFIFLQMVGSGVGSMMGSGQFWIRFFTTCVLALSGGLLFYFLSVAMISPISANRALPVRSYITVIWILGGLFGAYQAIVKSSGLSILTWSRISYFILCAALIVIVSNHDQLSVRVRRAIPRKPMKRALAFLFFNGAAGGLVWAVLLLAVTYFVTYVVESLFATTLSLSGSDGYYVPIAAVLLYAIAYALTGLTIQRAFFSRQSPKLAGIIAVFLAGMWALVPNIILFFLNRLSARSFENFQPGNIMNVFLNNDNGREKMHLLCAALWALVMVLINVKWFSRQLKHFRTYDPAEMIAAPNAIPPVIPRETDAMQV